jgi:hypothetical protein
MTGERECAIGQPMTPARTKVCETDGFIVCQA